MDNKKQKGGKGSAGKVQDIRTEALAFIETRGKTGTIGTLDIMPKTSDVSFFRRVNIGTGLVSVVYTGEVAAASSAQEAAENLAGKISEFHASNLIARPHERIYSLILQRSGEEVNVDSPSNSKLALGIVEIDGFVGMVKAADAGIKAADVQIPSWVTVGGGLTTVFFRGEVAAVHSAVEEGMSAAGKVAKIVSSHVIPQPHEGTDEVTPIGKFTGKSTFKKTAKDDALGILETKGITGLIEGIDAGLKSANVVVQGWEKIGRGITSTIFRGTVADVRSALDAAVSGAGRVGEVVGSYIIARPHEELEKGR
ncbi:MAG: BMC domain-containing protein [Elusimicrobia bacterium]|jgi:microcompartment protein CcmL/EutN|nr:BMC domain-containing protein [Elusimicrobiota bacterium]